MAGEPAVDAAVPESAPPVRQVRVAGNDWRLFVESRQYIPALVADIRQAQHRAWVEAYTFADDPAGRAVAAALKERAAAGVDCRVLYDAVGSLDTPAPFFDELRASGVHVVAYRPIDGWWWRWWMWRKFNRRNHRKLSIIDDAVGYFGGMNIVDEGGSLVPIFEPEGQPDGRPPWRDVHVRVAGDQAGALAASWEALWNELAGGPRRKRSNPRAKDVARMPPDSVLFFDSHPRVRHHRPAPLLRTLIDRAQANVVLAMAYFLPFGSVLRSLHRAHQRRVTIRVIVPENSDVPVVQWASRYAYEMLMRRGLRIYERRRRMLHSKVMVVDDEWSLIGSLNLDPRSLLLNLEFFAVVRSQALGCALGEICRDEFRHSRAVHLRDIRGRTVWERMKHRLAWYFKRWL